MLNTARPDHRSTDRTRRSRDRTPTARAHRVGRSTSSRRPLSVSTSSILVSTSSILVSRSSRRATISLASVPRLSSPSVSDSRSATRLSISASWFSNTFRSWAKAPPVAAIPKVDGLMITAPNRPPATSATISAAIATGASHGRLEGFGSDSSAPVAPLGGPDPPLPRRGGSGVRGVVAPDFTGLPPRGSGLGPSSHSEVLSLGPLRSLWVSSSSMSPTSSRPCVRSPAHALVLGSAGTAGGTTR